MTATFAPPPWPMPPGTPRSVPWLFGREVDRGPAAGQGSLVELGSRGRTLRVGRLLRPEPRAAFARELREAGRQLPAKIPPDTEPN